MLVTFSYQIYLTTDTHLSMFTNLMREFLNIVYSECNSYWLFLLEASAFLAVLLACAKAQRGILEKGHDS